jgi:Phasin protein
LISLEVREAIVRKNEDQGQFFKDVGATAEQAVEEVRGFEENYRAWASSITETLHDYAEQDFSAAFAFARELSEATNFSDFARIQMEYLQNCSQLFFSQAQDLTQRFIAAGLRAVAPPAAYSMG